MIRIKIVDSWINSIRLRANRDYCYAWSKLNIFICSQPLWDASYVILAIDDFLTRIESFHSIQSIKNIIYIVVSINAKCWENIWLTYSLYKFTDGQSNDSPNTPYRWLRPIPLYNLNISAGVGRAKRISQQRFPIYFISRWVLNNNPNALKYFRATFPISPTIGLAY